MKKLIPQRSIIIISLIILILVLLLGTLGINLMLKMPGKSYRGEFLPLSPEELAIKQSIKDSVYYLAETLGERNIWHLDALNGAAEYIAKEFKTTGMEVIEQEYQISNISCKNIIAVKKGKVNPEEIIVIGAHYDSVLGSPGADDNASGVAALLAIARKLAQQNTTSTIHFVAFVNEEPPFFYSKQMGSWHYAKQAKEKNLNIKAMLSLESIGFYATEKNSQNYPFPFNFFYPSQANFIGFVSNIASRFLLKESITLFRQYALFPSEGLAAPTIIPGVSWSDQWSFWRHGYPAIMITGTALYRNPHYHTAKDLANTLNYDAFARVVLGISFVVKNLASKT